MPFLRLTRKFAHDRILAIDAEGWILVRSTLGALFSSAQGIEVFLFVPFDSFLYSVDLLGYSLTSVATLFAARVFTGHGLERIVRLFLLANGLLLPFIALQTYFRPLIWVASLWAVTFPGSAWSLALLFRRGVCRGDWRDTRGVS